MADYRFKTAGTIKKGDTVVIDDTACVVKKTQTSRPGKHGHAKVRMQVVGMLNDKKKEVVMPGDEKIKTPIINKNHAQVLSVSGDTANVMDSESYKTFDLEIPEELSGDVQEGGRILYWEIMSDKVMKEIVE